MLGSFVVVFSVCLFSCSQNVDKIRMWIKVVLMRYSQEVIQ